MELQFQKNQMPYLRQLTRQVFNQEQTVEVRLEEGMPEIGRVLGTWGQVILRGKQWQGESVLVSGGVMAWVLYIPEDGGPCRSVETWLPLQWKVDIPAVPRDGTVMATGWLRSLDGRCLSGRKLMVCADVQMLIRISVQEMLEMPVPEELPEDVQLLEQTYQAQVPVEAGEKPFMIDEQLPLPAGLAEVEKILTYSIQPELIDKKLMTDKVVFRGMAIARMLYLGRDGKVHSWNGELPFAQYGELEQEYGDDGTVQLQLVCTSLELEQGQEGLLHICAGMTGQYTIGRQMELETVTDAYSVKRQVMPQYEMLQLPQIRETDSKRVPCRMLMQMPCETIVDATVYPMAPECSKEGDSLNVGLSGRGQVLYYNSEGELAAQQDNWHCQCDMGAVHDGGSQVYVSVTGNPQAMAEGDGCAVTMDLLVENVMTATKELQTLVSMELPQIREEEKEGPSLILRRAGQDSLWQIAKSAGSTVERIKAANGLDDMVSPEQILLIPIG